MHPVGFSVNLRLILKLVMVILKSVKNQFKNNWRLLTVILISIGFFAVASAYNFYTQKDGFIKWGSPDETANYVFAKLYGQTGELTIFEKYNLYGDDIIHPRSTRSDNGFLKPVSFLGIILIYGRLAALTNYKILPYLTPFFAAWGIFFFYLLIKKIFGKENAFLSVFLLAGFPAWIYYSSRSMFHNVLFVSLLIIGLYFCVLLGRKRKNKLKFLNSDIWKMDWLNFFYSALAGFFVGLAATVRSSEILWLAPVFFVLWIFNVKKTGLLKLLVFLTFIFLAVTPALCWNRILYGSFLSGGYSEMNESIKTIAVSGSDLFKTAIWGNFARVGELIGKIKNSIFYFGFKPEQSQRMFYYYFVRMFFWLFWPAFFGFFLFLERIKKWRKKHWLFVLSSLIFYVILIFYYVSLEFYDNPAKGALTIGNSHIRYWLPVYLTSMPLAAFFIMKFSFALFFQKAESEKTEIGAFPKSKPGFFRLNPPKKKFLVAGLKAFFIIVILFISASFTLYGSEEGLVYSADNYYSAQSQYFKVLSLTEKNSIIITEYHDKLFFPERKVIVGRLTENNMNAIYARLANYLPVYYYNFTFSEKDFNYLNEKKLLSAGLSLKKVKQIDFNFSLYRLKITGDKSNN